MRYVRLTPGSRSKVQSDSERLALGPFTKRFLVTCTFELGSVLCYFCELSRIRSADEVTKCRYKPVQTTDLVEASLFTIQRVELTLVLPNSDTP